MKIGCATPPSSRMDRVFDRALQIGDPYSKKYVVTSGESMSEWRRFMSENGWRVLSCFRNHTIFGLAGERIHLVDCSWDEEMRYEMNDELREMANDRRKRLHAERLLSRYGF